MFPERFGFRHREFIKEIGNLIGQGVLYNIKLRTGGDIVMEPERISPKEVYQKLKSGAVLLVCAYEDEARFKNMQLEGAISLSEFKSKLPALAKDQEVVFYCG